MRRTSFFKAAAAVCTLTMCLGTAACGSDSSSDSDSDSSSSSSSTKMNQIAGVTATGKLGEKPTISFKTPMTVENNSYAVLQEGDGDQLEDGDRVCSQGIAYNVKDGSELMSTWEDNTPDCSTVISSDTDEMNAEYYELFTKQKINSTIAIGVNDSSSSGSSYLMVFTFVSKSKDLTKAEGTKVLDVPADLPKVTLDKTGKPSIDMNGYKGSDTLVSQDLIKGNGAKVKDTQTVVAHYTGWLLDGTQFDSSWDRDESSSFSLDSVITGWKQGLAGHTVGSQVLLVVPPDLGYGDQEQSSIPANSTLVFVVDILAAY
jgi:peptidylprolyl isomerase